MTAQQHDATRQDVVSGGETSDGSSKARLKSEAPPIWLGVVLTLLAAVPLLAYQVSLLKLVLGSYAPALCVGLWYYLRQVRSLTPQKVAKATFAAMLFAVFCAGIAVPAARMLIGP